MNEVWTTSEQRIRKALDYQAALEEPMVLFVPRSEVPATLRVVREYGYTVVGDYESVIETLRRGQSIAIYSTEHLSTKVYDVVRQYAVRGGAIQTQCVLSGELSLIELDPAIARVLIVIPEECEAAVADRSPRLFDVCGIVERLQ